MRLALFAPFLVLSAVAEGQGQARAAASEMTVALDYAVDPALAGCPAAGDFRRDVAGQLGHDPFDDRAARRVVIRLQPAGGAQVAGRMEWRDGNEARQGERTFSSRGEGCAQIARAMAFVVALQIQLLARAPSAEPSPPPPVEPPSPPPPPAPTATEKRRTLVGITVGAGVLQDLGESPLLLLPRFAVSLDRPSGLGVRLAVSGLGPGADVTRTEGVARLDRLVMTLEVVRFFRGGRGVLPLLALGAGWQDVRARGTSAMPSLAPAHAGHVFTGLVSAGGGAAFVLAPQLFAVVELDALLFRPAVAVEVGSSEAVRLDGVTLSVHGGLLARF